MSREYYNKRVPCPTRLQYDQWHSEGTRLLGSDRVTPPVSKPQSGRQTVNVLVATGAESRSDEAVGTKIITDAEVSFGAKPNIIKSGPYTHERCCGYRIGPRSDQLRLG